MAKEKVQDKVRAIQWPKKNYKIKDRQCTGQRNGTNNPMAKEKVQNKVQSIQWPKKKYKIKYRRSNGQRKRTKQSTGNPMAKRKSTK
jgi:hypothetical protein